MDHFLLMARLKCHGEILCESPHVRLVPSNREVMIKIVTVKTFLDPTDRVRRIADLNSIGEYPHNGG
ncbi:MAG: hypothetical protein ABS61_12760 [Microbacterium sp. SCN 70-18]|nr:MAG: hypothetical protein ABS61_12760 [Microbacterium sp. SCN 70-18]